MLLLKPSTIGNFHFRPFFHDVFDMTNGGKLVASNQDDLPGVPLSACLSIYRRDGRVVECAGLLN